MLYAPFLLHGERVLAKTIELMHARADDDWADERDLIEAMREEAARLGVPGIIVDWIKEPRMLEHVIDHLTDIDFADRRGRVVAIRAVGG